MAQVEVYADLEALSHAAADRFVKLAREAIQERGRFNVALSGGGTPQKLFNLLAQRAFAEQVQWSDVHVFWGDERAVPPSDEGSNYFQAKIALLDHVSLRPERIHRIKGELGSQRTAAEYAALLKQFGEDDLDWPRFDLALMGLGSDGHTASLFPGQGALLKSNATVIAVTVNYEDRPANRVSLTPQVFNSARNVIFLVSGASKAQALTAVTKESADVDRWPAARIQPEAGELIWMVDKAAAGK